MAFIIVENVRGFFNSRPPLVVFMICMASFAIALITFAYIVKTKDMPNPDISEDWNTFLSKFSDLKFCISHDASTLNTTSKLRVLEQSPGELIQSIDDKIKETAKLSKRSLSSGEVHTTHHTSSSTHGRTHQQVTSEHEEKPTTTSTVSTGRDAIINVTLLLHMEIIPNKEVLALPLSSVHFTAAVTGNMLMMTGSHREKNVQITFSFPSNLSHSTCEEVTGNVCTLYVLPTCVTFSGPAYMLPHTQKPAESDTCPGEAEPAADSVFRNMTAATSSVSAGANWCAQGAKMTAEYSFDESLTVMLSEQDRSMINLHLMRTSYFLFVMVVTLFCYAMIKGRPGKVKTTTHIPYEKVSSQA